MNPPRADFCNNAHQNQIDIDVRTPDLLQTDFAWINGMFDDFVRV